MSTTTPISTPFLGEDADLQEKLEEATRITGHSANTLVVACVRAALPRVVEALQPGGGRITNVEPLPDAVLDRLYARPEEEDEAGVRTLMAAQSFGGDD